MTHRLLPVLFALGCTPTIRIHTQTPGMDATIKAAGETVGVRTKIVDAPTDPRHAVVTVEFRSSEGSVCGQALEKVVRPKNVRDAVTGGLISCQPKAWSCDSETFLAHELGHIFGLNHVGSLDDPADDPKRDGLMHPSPNKGAQPTENQKLRARSMATVMNRVCDERLY